jgi:hypothetical protein
MARLPAPGAVRIPNTAEIKVIWGDGIREWSNVLHGSYQAPPNFNDALAEQVFTTIKTAFTGSGWSAMVNADVNLIRVELKDLNVANNAAYLSGGLPAAGTGALAQAAASLAIEVSLRTAKAGRGFVGRVYLGGLDTIAVADAYSFSQQTGGFAVAFIEAIISGLPAAGFSLAIAQRALLAGTDANGNPMPARPADKVIVTSARMTDHRLDSQRRRLGR